MVNFLVGGGVVMFSIIVGYALGLNKMSPSKDKTDGS